MRKIYKNALIENKLCDFSVVNGKFEKFGKFADSGENLNGLTVIPGLIDIHIHGCLGFDVMEGNALEPMSKYLASRGVTAFLPTTMTMPFNDIRLATNVPLQTSGAKVPGFHLEGPYIAKSRRGAQNIAHIKNPNIAEFNTLKNIRLVTLAPEIDGAIEFIKECGAVVSIGHSNANYEKTLNAINAGANCLTHTFNAMTPLTHREPGIIGAAVEKNIFAQVICDGVHVHNSVLKMLYKIFGRERMIVISDALCATGMADGEYTFGGQNITVKNKTATLKNGVLAGSCADILDGVKNLISIGIPKADAIFMASRTPAMLLNENKGLLKEGFDADFAVADDDFNIYKTVIAGNTVFQK